MTPITLRQIIGCIVFIGGCVTGVLGDREAFDIGPGYVPWVVSFIAGGVGALLMVKQPFRGAFGCGAWIGLFVFLLSRGYVALRPQASLPESIAVTVVLSGLAASFLWRMLDPSRWAIEAEINSLEHRATSHFDAMVDREVRRRAGRYFDEAVDQELRRERESGGSRSRKQISKELEGRGLRRQMESELRDKVAKELAQQVDERSAAILKKERMNGRTKKK